MRAKRSELESLVSQTVIESVIKTSPGLRDSIRAALDKGATPRDLRSRFGSSRKRKSMTHLAADWLIDEWERERGLVKADESIDTL